MAKALILLVALSIAAPALAQDAPYAGQQQRPIKALSAQEIDDLLAGRGMGLAKAAELNSYPGPAHVLDLAERLQLDDAQKARIAAIRASMSERAQRLGRQLIGLEAALEQAFASGAIDDAGLSVRLAEIGRVQGELRAAHLQAHIQTKAVLSAHQVMLYDQARGYAAADVPAAGHGGHKH